MRDNHIRPTTLEHAMRLMALALTVALLTTVWLTGCGNRGPLYLPEDVEASD